MWLILNIAIIAWFVWSLRYTIKGTKENLPPKKKTLMIINMVFASIGLFFVICALGLTIIGLLIVQNM